MRLIYLLMVILCACVSPNPGIASLTQDISQNAVVNLEIDNNIFGPEDFPANVNPLTGELVDDPAILRRRPIVVKISNAPPLVRPQAGIGSADVVFEHYAEGGLTRFSAVFYGQAPDRVGSIRSARLVDHEIIPMVDGMLVFSGASIGVEKYIYGSAEVASRIDGADTVPPYGDIPPSEYAERAYKGVLYGRPYYWRDEAIPVPHNMFADMRAIWALAESEGHAVQPDLQGMAFRLAPPVGAVSPGRTADIRYRATRVRWVYDDERAEYLRFADGQPHFDANTETQISADNVIIVYAEHTDTDIIESQWQDSISWSTQIAVWGENRATLLRDGQHYDGYWTRTVREHIIGLRTWEGDLLYLKPGQTWFQLVQPETQQNPAEEWIIIE